MLSNTLDGINANPTHWLLPKQGNLSPLRNNDYKSPFNELYGLKGPNFSLAYSGTLDTVLDDLTQQRPTHNPEILALHPARIIRAVVDYKIDNPVVPLLEELLKSAITVALGVYQQPRLAQQPLEDLRQKIRLSSYAALLDAPLLQPDDSCTQIASDPLKSQETAQRLLYSNAGDVLFIALGHGGVAAGMDVYLRYCDLSASQNSAFYVARLSMAKKQDTQPRLSPTEQTYLQEQAQGRQVILFDEDIASGRSLHAANEYFFELFAGTPLHITTNLDLRATIAALGGASQLLNINELNTFEKHNSIVNLYNKLSSKNISNPPHKEPLDMIHHLNKSYSSNFIKKIVSN